MIIIIKARILCKLHICFYGVYRQNFRFSWHINKLELRKSHNRCCRWKAEPTCSGRKIFCVKIDHSQKISWYSGTRNIVILWTLVDNFFHFYYQLEESYKSSMTDVFEPSENGSSETKVGRAQSRDECQKLIALP
jgi:hypothetical protein